MVQKITKYAWIGTSLLLLGGFLLCYFKWVDYGIALFVLFPVAVGFAAATHKNRSDLLGFWMVTISGLFLLVVLAIVGLEGLICVLMTIPLLLLSIWIGYLLGRFVSKKYFPPDSDQGLNLQLWPLLLLLVTGKIEREIAPKPGLSEVTSSITLAYPPEAVFDRVKEMKKMDAPKPLLLQIGLPAPYKCTIEGNGAGAQRVCHFKEGQILTTITHFDRPYFLKMDVVQYDLPGKAWFNFQDAAYVLEYDGKNTKITRTSTYKSILRPRIYWQPVESWCIEQEHRFVLESLKKNLAEAFNH